jgi:hypothetical protein
MHPGTNWYEKLLNIPSQPEQPPPQPERIRSSDFLKALGNGLQMISTLAISAK